MAVFTSLNNGSLHVTGDGGAVDIVGTENPGEFRVTGKSQGSVDTVVDGVPNGTTTIAGVIDDLIVHFTNISEVALDNVYIAGDIRISLSSGNGIGGGGKAILGAISPSQPAAS